jgi:hypothetical protein
VVLAVGYRVNSARGTQFRQWATAQLEQYLVKGFAMDDERLKQAGGGGYFDELLARIRDIRSSARVFWRKVLDIYTTSVDYDPSADASQSFFAVVQNKMHWAAHGASVPLGQCYISRSSLPVGVSISHPFSVTTTVSSMRIPPNPSR